MPHSPEKRLKSQIKRNIKEIVKNKDNSKKPENKKNME